ncbi:hypothetical protein BLX87_14750 [Bacillus sp. VT-16-64]|nr:hypothetical protein BLX87_14750 [Bacillus sp. VT-16-64]
MLLYAEQNDQEVRRNLHILDDMELWTETADLSREIAEYYKNKDDLEKAAYYFTHGGFAKYNVLNSALPPLLSFLSLKRA